MSPFNVSETYLQVQYQKSKFYASVRYIIKLIIILTK